MSIGKGMFLDINCLQFMENIFRSLLIINSFLDFFFHSFYLNFPAWNEFPDFPWPGPIHVLFKSGFHLAVMFHGPSFLQGPIEIMHVVSSAFILSRKGFLTELVLKIPLGLAIFIHR